MSRTAVTERGALCFLTKPVSCSEVWRKQTKALELPSEAFTGLAVPADQGGLGHSGHWT